MLGQGSNTRLSGGLCAPSSRGLFCFCGLVAKHGSRSGQAAKRPSASSHGLSLASECRFQPSVLRIVSLAVLSFALPSSFQTSTQAPARRGWDCMICLHQHGHHPRVWPLDPFGPPDLSPSLWAAPCPPGTPGLSGSTSCDKLLVPSSGEATTSRCSLKFPSSFSPCSPLLGLFSPAFSLLFFPLILTPLSLVSVSPAVLFLSAASTADLPEAFLTLCLSLLADRKGRALPASGPWCILGWRWGSL